MDQSTMLGYLSESESFHTACIEDGELLPHSWGTGVFELVVIDRDDTPLLPVTFPGHNVHSPMVETLCGNTNSTAGFLSICFSAKEQLKKGLSRPELGRGMEAMVQSPELQSTTNQKEAVLFPQRHTCQRHPAACHTLPSRYSAAVGFCNAESTSQLGIQSSSCVQLKQGNRCLCEECKKPFRKGVLRKKGLTHWVCICMTLGGSWGSQDRGPSQRHEGWQEAGNPGGPGTLTAPSENRIWNRMFFMSSFAKNALALHR